MAGRRNCHQTALGQAREEDSSHSPPQNAGDKHSAFTGGFNCRMHHATTQKLAQCTQKLIKKRVLKQIIVSRILYQHFFILLLPYDNVLTPTSFNHASLTDNQRPSNLARHSEI